MTTTSKRGVIDIREVAGPNGGTILVHTLTCGHWLTRRTATKRAQCIACYVAEALPKRGETPMDKALAALDAACSYHFECDNDCPDVKDAAWEVVKIYRDLKEKKA